MIATLPYDTIEQIEGKEWLYYQYPEQIHKIFVHAERIAKKGFLPGNKWFKELSRLNWVIFDSFIKNLKELHLALSGSQSNAHRPLVLYGGDHYWYTTSAGDHTFLAWRATPGAPGSLKNNFNYLPRVVRHRLTNQGFNLANTHGLVGRMAGARAPAAAVMNGDECELHKGTFLDYIKALKSSIQVRNGEKSYTRMDIMNVSMTVGASIAVFFVGTWLCGWSYGSAMQMSMWALLVAGGTLFWDRLRRFFYTA